MNADSDVERELKRMTIEHDLILPVRGSVDDYLKADWKEGKPDYNRADLEYFKGKTKNHPSGSLEIIVENLVKQWEMEMTHLPSKDWKTIESLESYRVQVNGGRQIDGKEAAKVGTYNWIMENAPKCLYNAQAETFESSHKLFRDAFRDGFPWEVIEVFSGPPKVAFSWRHWGVFNGEYKGAQGKDETIELTGFVVATLSDASKIIKLEIYTKFDSFLQALQGGKRVSGCPM